jgi:hypothetical protein
MDTKNKNSKTPKEVKGVEEFMDQETAMELQKDLIRIAKESGNLTLIRRRLEEASVPAPTADEIIQLMSAFKPHYIEWNEAINKLLLKKAPKPVEWKKRGTKETWKNFAELKKSAMWSELGKDSKDALELFYYENDCDEEELMEISREIARVWQHPEKWHSPDYWGEKLAEVTLLLTMANRRTAIREDAFDVLRRNDEIFKNDLIKCRQEFKKDMQKKDEDIKKAAEEAKKIAEKANEKIVGFTKLASTRNEETRKALEKTTFLEQSFDRILKNNEELSNLSKIWEEKWKTLEEKITKIEEATTEEESVKEEEEEEEEVVEVVTTKKAPEWRTKDFQKLKYYIPKDTKIAEKYYKNNENNNNSEMSNVNMKFQNAYDEAYENDKRVFSRRKNKNMKCRRCLEYGHSATICQNKTKCLICREEGHVKTECPFRFRCNLCKTYLHDIGDCPNLSFCAVCKRKGHETKDCQLLQKGLTCRFPKGNGKKKRKFKKRKNQPWKNKFRRRRRT